jgi:hypothetical protein
LSRQQLGDASRRWREVQQATLDILDVSRDRLEPFLLQGQSKHFNCIRVGVDDSDDSHAQLRPSKAQASKAVSRIVFDHPRRSKLDH